MYWMEKIVINRGWRQKREAEATYFWIYLPNYEGRAAGSEDIEKCYQWGFVAKLGGLTT